MSWFMELSGDAGEGPVRRDAARTGGVCDEMFYWYR
jgi:hypothetical protein